MRLLIVGNSQAGVLKEAHDADPTLLGFNPYFYVVPGGTGPYLKIKDDRLVVTTSIGGFPPRIDPPEADAPLSSFDAIVVSALGYVDGGFKFQNPITTVAAVADFGPRIQGEVVSAAAFHQIVQAGLQRQRGFVFLDALRSSYSGPIIVQPFPRPSGALQLREDWGLRQDYADWLGMHDLIERARIEFLEAKARELKLTLLELPYGDPRWTPESMMRSVDLIHARAEYGAIVLRQIAQALQPASVG